MGNSQSSQSVLQNYRIQLMTSAQKIDDSGLFDSDARTSWVEHPPQQGIFVRDENKVNFLEDGNKKTHSYTKIASMTCTDKLRIHNVSNPCGLWQIIQKGYKIQCNDILKFGRFRTRVCEVNDKKVELQNSYDSVIGQCQYCLKETQEKVIKPCNCSTGTLSLIHPNCFLQWFKRNHVPFEYVNSLLYQWKRLECQNCKIQLTYNFKVDNQQLCFINFPKQTYMVLELLSKDSSSMKGLYVITGDVKIGRQQGVNVRLSDSTISREHATIKIQNNEFCLSDSASKFGTMVHIEESSEIPMLEGEYIFQALQTRIMIRIISQKRCKQERPLDLRDQIIKQGTQITMLSQFSTVQESLQDNNQIVQSESPLLKQ